MLAKILFVDDEQNVLNAHSRSFRAYKDCWDMRFANSGTDALQALIKEPVDVIVSDLAMPNMKGLELVAAVKKLNPDTVCIILTGTGDMHSALDAINQLDVFRYYLKPCSPEELAQGISDAIEFKTTEFNSQELLEIGKTTLDRVPYGVFVLSVDARVMFLNAFASELIDASDGLQIGHNKILRTNRPFETKLLHGAIRNASQKTEPSGLFTALFVDREMSTRPLHCVIQQFSSASENNEHEPRAAVFVTDPDRTPLISPKILAGLFELTGSESRLLSCLIASGRLEQAAKDANLSLSTARTYLKQVFAKTGTGRQGELIQLVLLSPALIELTK